MRKLLAGALLALVAGSVAAPSATAHNQANTHDYRWADDAPTPKSDGTLERLSETDFSTIKVQLDDGVTWWKIEMRHEASGAASFCERALTEAQTAASKGAEAEFLRCNWDTTRLGDMTSLEPDAKLGGGPVAPNGVYVVSGWVKNGDGYCGVLCARATPNELHALAPFKVEVANGVSPVSGVQRSYNSASRTVTVAWNASPEPDIAKYIVQEKFEGSDWKTVGERPGNTFSFEKALDQVGSYQYRVAAERPLADTAASFSAPTPVLEVAATPTTAGGDGPQPEPGSPAAEEPGVFEPTDPTSPTTAGSGGTTGTTRGGTTGGGKATTESPRGLFSPGSIFAPRPYTSSGPAARPTTTTTDPGYSEALPYKTPATTGADESALPGIDEEPKMIKKIVQVPSPKDPRALLVPLAGGLAVFVFSMQLTYVMRRRPAFSQGEDDFGDWVGI